MRRDSAQLLTPGDVPEVDGGEREIPRYATLAVPPARIVPSGENARQLIALGWLGKALIVAVLGGLAGSWPEPRHALLPGGEVIEPDRPVGDGGGQQPAIGRDGQRSDVETLDREPAPLPARGEIPEPRRALLGPDQSVAVA